MGDSGGNCGDWVKKWSATHNKDYWFNSYTGKSVWENPEKSAWEKKWSSNQNRYYWWDSLSGSSVWEDPIENASKRLRNDPTEKAAKDKASNPSILLDLMRTEAIAVAVNDSVCPRLISKTDTTLLVSRLRTEKASKSFNLQDGGELYDIVFTLTDDDTAMITRAIQEDQILKTRLKLRKDGAVIDLPSFWEVWNHYEDLRRDVLRSADPHEAMWTLQKRYGYKLATTFMPGYAKAIYEHFNAREVLDPCAGWGDRLLGAGATMDPVVNRYVAFDPNRTLRPGYAKIMQSLGNSLVGGDEMSLCFSNGFEVHSQPFELGALSLAPNSFDLVFTSPPFFDYEMYNPENPSYKDWIGDFYVPLMQQACRLVRPGHCVAIHIGDTSAGAIVPFLKTRVPHLCPLRLVRRLGLRGVVSDKMRPVWVFEKAFSEPQLATLSSRSQRVTDFLQPKTRLFTITGPGGKQITVFDDGICLGGTKQRVLYRLLQTVKVNEVVYAGPDGGLAQVALALAARATKKKAYVFLNTASTSQLPPLARLAQGLGATLMCSEGGQRTLKDTQDAASKFVNADAANRSLLPFGLHAKPGELIFEMLKSALLASLPPSQPAPKRLWIVAGSGFLFSVLSKIWPSTEFLVVQVGKTVWPDQLAGIHSQLFVAKEAFGETASQQPPYETVPWYDAKLWQFVLTHSENGDAIWNVGKIPLDPAQAAQEAVHLIDSALKYELI